jgi:predicted transcriptional regulator
MFQANLSYKILGKYLELAVDNGFLTLNSPNYEVTKTGQEFLVRYKLVTDKYSKIQWLLQEINNERKALKQLCPKFQPNTNVK